MRSFVGLALAATFTVLALVVPAWAQYPERPLTIVQGYPAGGMVDIVLRAITEPMKKKFPKGIGLVNRPGAGGSIGAAEGITAKPDGYTLLFTPISPLVIQAQMTDLPFKTPDDYEPIASVISYYPLLAVKHDAPWKSAQEFLAAARATPGKLRVGSPGEGTSSHLNLEELKRFAGVNLTHVPFSGWAESSVALLGGHVEAIVAQPGEVRPHVEGKRMRVLTVFQPDRNAAFADAPTARELGYAAANGISFLFVAPKGTPAPVLRHVLDAVKAATEEPAFVRMASDRAIGVDFRSGDRLKADLWREYKAHTEILQRLGIIKK
jgi:putative tricarboxylic transport membrane protein